MVLSKILVICAIILGLEYVEPETLSGQWVSVIVGRLHGQFVHGL
jgi:hypothetical protein